MKRKINKVKSEVKPDYLQWRTHTPNLLREILNNRGTSILRTPLNIFQNQLAQVAQRACELDDPQLNILMLRLTLYEVPLDQISNKIAEQSKRIKK